MRLVPFFLIAFFPLQLSFAQQANLFSWREGVPLQWSHFQGKPEIADKVHGAVTYAGFDMEVEKIHFPGGHLRFKARAVFDRKRSWVKAGEPDSLLLAHEQLHFDITEIYARKLMHKLNSLQLRKKDKLLLKKWQNHYWQAQLKAQKQYDRDSMHGLRFEEQQAWRSLINAELRSTSPLLDLNAAGYAVKR